MSRLAVPPHWGPAPAGNEPGLPTEGPSEGKGLREPPSSPGWARKGALGLVLAGWFAYTLTWATLSDLRILAFRASVFDLGLFLEQGWQVYSTAYSPMDLVFAFFRFGGNLVFWPVTLGGLWGMVAFQSLLLGAGGVLVYLLARQLGLPTFPSLAFPLIYYLYFPLAGVNFTDYHVEAFLIPLFLGGVLLLLQEHFRWSLLLLLLAGMLWYPLAVYPALLGFMTLAGSLAYRRLQPFGAGLSPPGARGTGRGSWFLHRIAGGNLLSRPGPLPTWYSAGLLAGGTALLLGGTLVVAPSSANSSALAVAHAVTLSPSTGLADKGFTLLLLFAPLGFLPFLSPRWFVFLTPYLFLVLTAGYDGYLYPGIVTDWHAFLFIPFAFLAALDGLAALRSGRAWVQRLRGSTPSRGTPPSEALAATPWKGPPFRSRTRRGALCTGLVLVALVSTLVTTSFLTPYGPFNSSTPASFRSGELVGYNQTLYDEFVHLAGLIPRNAPSVVFQDNMPELLPRPLMPGAIGPMVPGPFGGLAYNMTYPTATGGWRPVEPEYVVGNPDPLPDSFFNATGTFPFNLSLAEVLGHLYASGRYGVLGEAQGMWVIAAHYSGAPRYYVPYAATIPPVAFTSPRGVVDPPRCTTPCLFLSDISNGETAWYGPYHYLAPGSYNVSFRVTLQNWSLSDSVTLDVTHHGGKQVLGSVILHRVPGAPATQSLNVTIPVTLQDGFASVEFRAVDSYFTGGLFLYSVSVTETAPP